MYTVTQLCLTLWDSVDYLAHQAPLSMGFSRQKYWRGLPFADLDPLKGSSFMYLSHFYFPNL